MVIGITMLKVLDGHEAEAYHSVKNVKGVKEVYHILGEYSLFIIIQADNKQILYRQIDAIKEISHVTSIWHILVSKDDQQLQEEAALPEINRTSISGSFATTRFCLDALENIGDKKCHYKAGN